MGNDIIQIAVEGSELEIVTITLSSAEVANLYKANKEQKAKIEDLEKKLERSEQNYKWSNEARDRSVSEIAQANTLLTALGVQLKTDSEPVYNQQDLPVATRIALYIAKKGN